VEPSSAISSNLWTELDKLFSSFDLKKWTFQLDTLIQSQQVARELAQEARTLFDLYRTNQKLEHQQKAFGYALLHCLAMLKSKQMAPVIACIQDLQFISAPATLLNEVESRMSSAFAKTIQPNQNLRDVTSEILPPISDLHLFSSLGMTELRTIINISQSANFEPNAIIFKEGDSPDYFYIVANGSVQLTNQYGLNEILGAGDFFGEMALMTSHPRQATAQAIGKLKCLIFSKEELTKVFQNSPLLKERIIECFYLRSFLNQITKSKAFSEFTPSELCDFFYCFKAMAVESGKQLFAEGEPSDSMFFILSGEIEIKNRSLSIQKKLRSGFFGEMGFVSGASRSATAIATKRSHLLQLETYFLSDLKSNHPKIYAILQKVAAGRELINKGLIQALHS